MPNVEDLLDPKRSMRRRSIAIPCSINDESKLHQFYTSEKQLGLSTLTPNVKTDKFFPTKQGKFIISQKTEVEDKKACVKLDQE
jgi:hypothetical protein